MSETWEPRFWAKVNKTDGCWLWMAGKKLSGYGQLQMGTFRNPKQMSSHRLSWSLANGPIPPGMSVCHKCDVPSCVRPDHLFLGTQKQNLADMVKKGRHARVAPKGEAHCHAKLTAANVLEARRLHKETGIGCNRLGRMFGVNFRTMNLVLARKTWKHI